MPGFTHLQVAQPVTLGHHLLAYHEMLQRDVSRFSDARGRMNESPLGSAALAGTGFPLDREATAKALGFDRPTANSLDSVSDRDFALDYLSAAATCSLHLSRLAEEIVSELREQDPGRLAEVRIEPGLVAWADPALARNLLQNLLDNAWKFTTATTAPSIRLYRDGHSFVVEDNGAGFDPNYANKLFRPFQRLHPQQEFAGHGIGLATVRRILERHGGGIRAEGKPGVVILPARRAEDQAGGFKLGHQGLLLSGAAVALCSFRVVGAMVGAVYRKGCLIG